MNATANAHITHPADSQATDLLYTFTGQQIINALENHYNAIRKQINTILFETNRLNTPILVKNTALNILTNGEYGKWLDQHRKLRSLPVEQEQCKKIIHEIENRYTKPPYLVELCRQIKSLEREYNHTIENNNRNLAILQTRAQTTLQEKHKLRGLEKEQFTIDTNKVSELHKKQSFQEQVKRLIQNKIADTVDAVKSRMKL